MAMIPTKEKIILASVKAYRSDENTHRHAFQAGAEWAIEQMKQIPTSERLVTENDADYDSQVMWFLLKNMLY